MALFGPDDGSGLITTFADFGSTATQCADPWCSQASLSQDPKGNWSIDAMVLYGAGEWVTLPLPNSSEIVASIDAQGGWSFAPFEIGYRDALDQPWSLQVQASRWR